MFFQQSAGIENIAPEQLAERLQAGDDLFLLDVRTPLEHAAYALEGSHLIPIEELGQRLHELPQDREIVVYCRVGSRSAYACMHLARMGYRVRNLEGGVLLWSTSGMATAPSLPAMTRA
ncbi:MAG: hypothetical protein A2X56_11285 [Nitrospirae bacterium GWC2_57_13]|nr:MAG: hypothetical protein A2072_08340 [Nitrospirae bacterium GWC1_57_7]OGW26252.1 MAG: hypothetical protein A2X56_11285 [Nitrospirae bacterium GWC2_57_13]HAS54176.1 hypothetical protein [Nitrospiraceae bacterium]